MLWRSSRGRPFLRKPVEGLPRGGRELDFKVLSHAGGYNLLGVVRRHRIGVGIGTPRPGPEHRRHRRELRARGGGSGSRAAPAGDRDRRILRLWTPKEALRQGARARLDSLDSFAFTLADDEGVPRLPAARRRTAGQWRFAELGAGTVCASPSPS
ncbi:hypothetical protein [Streptomyces sp. KL116D]|uniref:hypothetical protein n=1 Tax=Streptomyces sp. KL116D TaxID=3045152 RepID=UPI003556A6DE